MEENYKEEPLYDFGFQPIVRNNNEEEDEPFEKYSFDVAKFKSDISVVLSEEDEYVPVIISSICTRAISCPIQAIQYIDASLIIVIISNLVYKFVQEIILMFFKELAPGLCKDESIESAMLHSDLLDVLIQKIQNEEDPEKQIKVLDCSASIICSSKLIRQSDLCLRLIEAVCSIANTSNCLDFLQKITKVDFEDALTEVEKIISNRLESDIFTQPSKCLNVYCNIGKHDNGIADYFLAQGYQEFVLKGIQSQSTEYAISALRMLNFLLKNIKETEEPLNLEGYTCEFLKTLLYGPHDYFVKAIKTLKIWIENDPRTIIPDLISADWDGLASKRNYDENKLMLSVFPLLIFNSTKEEHLRLCEDSTFGDFICRIGSAGEEGINNDLVNILVSLAHSFIGLNEKEKFLAFLSEKGIEDVIVEDENERLYELIES